VRPHLKTNKQTNKQKNAILAHNLEVSVCGQLAQLLLDLQQGSTSWSEHMPEKVPHLMQAGSKREKEDELWSCLPVPQAVDQAFNTWAFGRHSRTKL
jgi:hypothetical protein